MSVNIPPDSKPIWMRPKRESKIVICEMCHGTGHTRLHTDNPHHEGPYILDCLACTGKGRVKRIITTEHFTLSDDDLKKYTY